MTRGLVTFRDLEPADLADLAWSGTETHLAEVAGQLGRAYADEAVLLAGELPNRRLVALGGLDLARERGVGVLWMLSVHEIVQSLGIGTALIAALEDRGRRAGCSTLRLTVEHDNPRALSLYRRLGYVETGTAVESWPVSGGLTYVTVCAVLERSVRQGDSLSAP